MRARGTFRCCLETAAMEKQRGPAVDAQGGRSCCCCCCPAWRLPRGLALGPSQAAESGLGVWCVGGALRPGTLLLLLGSRGEEPRAAALPSACWKETSTCSGIISWRSLVKRSQEEDEANVSFVWFSGQLHIQVCCPIPPGTELLYWLSEPDASPASLEKSTPASESDAVVAERVELQKPLAVAMTETTGAEEEALVQQGGAVFDGNSADLFAGAPNVCKMLEQNVGACCVPMLDEKQATKQPLELKVNHNRKNESEALQCELTEAKEQSEESQSLLSFSIVKDDESQENPLSHPQAEAQEKETVTQMESVGAPSQTPQCSAVRLSARLAGKLQKKEVQMVQSCAEEVPSRCVKSVPKESMDELEKDPTWKEKPHRQVCGTSQLKEASSAARRHQCEKCGKAFLQLCHLKKHHFVHTDHKPFLCTECGKSYSSQESFKAHLLGHRGVRPFPCPQCHKTYGTKRDLQEHQVVHTGQRPFVCPDCGKSFARRPSLRIHCKIHQAKETISSATRACQCVICGRHLANPGSLRNHMRLHTGERPYSCSYCPKSFRQQGNLRGHLRLHTGEHPYRCHFCGDTFPQRPELHRHLISHTGEAHLCTVCGKALRDPHTLRAHERLHTGERPFRCHLCPKSYPLATKLRRHQKAHHGNKPHQCNICGMGFALPQSLRRHHLEHKQSLNRDNSEPGTKGSQKLPSSEHPAVLLVHPLDIAVPRNKAELHITSDGHYIATQQSSTRHKDFIEIVYSDAEEECIIVQEQDSPSDMFIIQEGVGFSTVTEVVEVEVGT